MEGFLFVHLFKGKIPFFVFNKFVVIFITEFLNSLFGNKLIKNCICGWVDILKENYHAILFLVESGDFGKNSMAFTPENLNQLNQQELSLIHISEPTRRT